MNGETSTLRQALGERCYTKTETDLFFYHLNELIKYVKTGKRCLLQKDFPGLLFT